MVDQILSKRTVLVTGKGGVGKTTLVATLARVAASRGKRVLVAEMATVGCDTSSLAVLFGLKNFPRQRIEVAPNIWGVILLAQVGQERFVQDVIRSRTLAKAALASKAVQRLFATAPSCRELGILYHLLSEFRRCEKDGSPSYDLIVVDMPATGHALAVTSLPNVLLELFGNGHIADTLREGQAIFANSAQTHALVVSSPEPLAVTEALELISGLKKDNVAVGGTVVNQMVCGPTQTERAQLHTILKERPILGRHSLARLEVCDAAVARLEEATSEPMIRIPQFPFGDVVSQMSNVLGVGH